MYMYLQTCLNLLVSESENFSQVACKDVYKTWAGNNRYVEFLKLYQNYVYVYEYFYFSDTFALIYFDLWSLMYYLHTR